MHPLQIDMSGFTDNELEERIKDLTKRYFTVLRVSPGAAQQVVMLLDDYRSEQQSRVLRKQDEMSRTLGKDYDDLINIG